jgi:hypothetical protein
MYFRDLDDREVEMRIRCIASLAIALGLASVLSYAQAPVPLINLPLVPDAVAPGGAAFILTVNGTGFVSNSVVNWNRSARATTFVNNSQLTAAITAADIATPSTGWVTVVNPAPGGGTSNVAFFTVTANTGSAVAFTLASSVAVGQSPISVAVGDFNGDGKLDLAVVNACGNDPFCRSSSPGTVSILLGDGTGNFTLASSPATGGSCPSSVAVGDFNGDGNLDLAVVNTCGNDPRYSSKGTVSILLGDGRGNFTLASSLALGYGPQSVAVGDFNGDGNLDLAVVNACESGGCGYYQTTVYIFLGDGTGNFTLVSSPPTGLESTSVAVGDFDRDGKLDLAVVNFYDSTVSILVGDGTGNFTLASSLAAGFLIYSLAVGDFNADSNLDLAATSAYDGTVSILLGDGRGKFTLASSPAAGDWPWSLAVADFNGDSKLDLAVTNPGDDRVTVLLGNGTGNFTAASSPATGAYPIPVTVGDFNGDGRMDLAVANTRANTASILLQVPLVVLSPPLNFGSQIVGTARTSLAATLVNGTDASLTINNIGITGANSGDYSQTNNCGTSLRVGASCSISVTFTPTATGTRSATLTVTDSDASSPQTTSLTGVGLAAWPVATLSPNSLTFPLLPIGSSSAELPVTLSNTGGETLAIASIGAAEPFSETNTCGSTLAPPQGQTAGGSCTINVVFQPTSEGTATGSVAITDNAPGSPQTISLTGQGLGKPALSGSVLSKSKSGTTLTATVQLTDRGTGAAQQVSINQIALRTLSGTGTVTLTSPSLPAPVGNLAIGASTDVTLTLNVPATVTKFSVTESGTLQNIVGSTFKFAVAEVVYP